MLLALSTAQRQMGSRIAGSASTAGSGVTEGEAGGSLMLLPPSVLSPSRHPRLASSSPSRQSHLVFDPASGTLRNDTSLSSPLPLRPQSTLIHSSTSLLP